MKNENIVEEKNAQISLKVCLFCSEAVAMEEHITECKGLSAEMIHEKPTFYKIDGRGNLCKNCWCLLNETEWQYHRKAQICHVKYRNFISHRDLSRIGKPLSQPVNPIPAYSQSELKYASQGGNQLILSKSSGSSDPEEIACSEMLSIAKSIMAPLIRQWVQQNRRIDPKVLVVYLTSAVTEFGINFVNKKILTPTWESIKKADKSLNWQEILEKPQNIFNDLFIEGKLIRMTQRKQSRVIKGINRLANVYKGLIKKRQLPSIVRVSRRRSYVKIFDLLTLIKELLATKKLSLVHFGLDLYIILLSGQRFLADKQSIQKGVLALLAENRSSSRQSLALTFEMTIGKNKNNPNSATQQVCLNQQLCLLLNQFEWPGFHHKTQRLIQRMQEWLGIYGYSFKDCMLNAAGAVATDLRISQQIAAHRSIKSTMIYTRLTSVADRLRVSCKLVVPGLHSRFGNYDQNQLLEFLNSLTVDHIRYAQFKSEWFTQLLQRIYTTRYQHQYNNDKIVDLMEPSSQHQVQERNLIQSNHLGQDRIEDKNESPVLDDIDELIMQFEDKQSSVAIYGISIPFRNKRFNQSVFYDKMLGYSELKCNLCQAIIPEGEVRKKCCFCQGNYHISCSQALCKCVNVASHIILNYPTISSLNNQRISKQKFIMPQQYMLQCQSQEQQQIKILLAARRFRYTRVPIFPAGYPLIFPSQYRLDAQTIIMPQFAEYVNGKYMPPIQLLPNQQYTPHPVFGTQWGLFAKQTIENNVLIGQYSCDLLQGRDLVWCKKSDSIMRYTGGDTPEDIYLAPKDYCGYILLMNTSSKSNCNCRSMKVVLDGALRILILTNRRIGLGEQLYYYYGEGYGHKIKRTNA